MISKLLDLEPTNLKEVRVTLNETIAKLQAEAQQKLTSLQSDPKVAGSVKEHMATIEALGRAARDMEKLEAVAAKTMQAVSKRLRKQQTAA